MMHNSTILVLTSTYPRWECDVTPRFVESLCLELSKNNLKVVVLAPYFANTKKFEKVNGLVVHRFRYAPAKYERIAYEGGMLHNIRERPIVNSLVLASFLACQTFSTICLVYKYKCSVLHAHWLVPQGFVAAVVKRILFWKKLSVMVTVHGGDIYGIRGVFFEKIKNLIVGSCDTLTCVSRAVSRNFDNAKRVYIRSMGVYTQELFIPSEIDKRENLLFVGRLVDKKGCDILLTAFELVLKVFPEIKLNIIGEGPKSKELRQLAIDLKIEDKVNFIGAMEQKDLIKWYQTAKIFIMPSVIANSGDQEGLGLVAAEAMACECPVIASNLEAVKDLIDNNQNGILVEQGNPKLLSDAIIDLLSNPKMAKEISAHARDKIVSNFDWEVVGEGYAGFANELLNENSVSH